MPFKYIYQVIVVMGSYFISSSTWGSATCGILALGNQQLPERKMSNPLIILQINDLFLFLSQVYISLKLCQTSCTLLLQDTVLTSYNSILQFSKYWHNQSAISMAKIYVISDYFHTRTCGWDMCKIRWVPAKGTAQRRWKGTELEC